MTVEQITGVKNMCWVLLEAGWELKWRELRESWKRIEMRRKSLTLCFVRWLFPGPLNALCVIWPRSPWPFPTTTDRSEASLVQWIRNMSDDWSRPWIHHHQHSVRPLRWVCFPFDWLFNKGISSCQSRPCYSTPSHLSPCYSSPSHLIPSHLSPSYSSPCYSSPKTKKSPIPPEICSDRFTPIRESPEWEIKFNVIQVSESDKKWIYLSSLLYSCLGFKSTKFSQEGKRG